MDAGNILGVVAEGYVLSAQIEPSFPSPPDHMVTRLGQSLKVFDGLVDGVVVELVMVSPSV